MKRTNASLRTRNGKDRLTSAPRPSHVRAHLCLFAILTVFISAQCANEDPVAIESERPGHPIGISGWSIDVDGSWDWTREGHLTIPDEFAFIFGIQPEGPITQFRCVVSGVIDLDQSGDTFTGIEEETSSTCVTRGGQEFEQPGLGALIPITDGRIQGRVVQFLIGDPILHCPIHAVAKVVEDGRAMALEGTGRCVIPGHPKSDAPEGHPLDLDPPPAGTEKILVWEATRQAP